MLQKINERSARVIFFTAILILILLPFVSSQDFTQITKPLQTIYDLVKYATTIIAGLVMIFAGGLYITSGSDPGKREKAKNMVMYVIIGLMVIWAAPFVVQLILEG